MKKINMLNIVNKIVIAILFLLIIDQKAVLKNEIANVPILSQIDFSARKELENLLNKKFVFYGVLGGLSLLPLIAIGAFIKYIISDNKKEELNKFADKKEVVDLVNNNKVLGTSIEGITNKQNELEKKINYMQDMKQEIEKRAEEIKTKEEQIAQLNNQLMEEKAIHSKNLVDKIENEKQQLLKETENNFEKTKKEYASQLSLIKQEMAADIQKCTDTLNQNQSAFNNNSSFVKNFLDQYTQAEQKLKELIDKQMQEMKNQVSGVSTMASQLSSECNAFKSGIEQRLTQGYEEVLKEKKANEDYQAKLLAIKQAQEDRDKKRFEEEVTKEQNHKKWLEKNENYIKLFIENIEIIGAGIKNNADSFDYEVISGLFNDDFNHENLLFYFNNNYEKTKDIEWIDLISNLYLNEYLLSSSEIKMYLNKLINILVQEKQNRNNAPERNSIYINNKDYIKNVIDKINYFLNNKNLITEEDNEQYLKIIDNSINSESLFEYFYNLEKNDNKVSEIYQYLSKSDKKILDEAIKRINKETDLRRKDSKRQYNYYLNKNQNVINQYKKRIEEIINTQDDFIEFYRKFKEAECAKISDVLFLINVDIEDADKEIIDILLNDEYTKFIKNLHERLEQRGLQLVEKEKTKLQELINEITTIENITEDINTKYIDLINSINDTSFDCNEFFATVSCFNNQNNSSFSSIELEQYFIKNSKQFKTTISNKFKNFYTQLINEKKIRKEKPERLYQWYINKHKNDIDAIRAKIEEITTGVKDNQNKWYEDYQLIVFHLNQQLNDHSNILKSIILKNNLNSGLDIDKIVDYFKYDLNKLVAEFNSEKTQRKISPERCYIGRENKEKLEDYFAKMDEFIKSLDNQDTINEDINDIYNNVMDYQNSKQELDMFFNLTANCMNILFNQVNPLELYVILSVDTSNKIKFYQEKINKEKENRIINKKRMYQWYVNKMTLTEDINKINKAINDFIETSGNDSQEYIFKKQDDEELYLNLINYVNQEESIQIIDKLFDYYKINKENIEYSKLIHHVNWEKLLDSVKKEQSQRLVAPQRSHYYEYDICETNKCKSYIEEINNILGKISQPTSEEVNKFFNYIDKKNYDTELDLFVQVLDYKRSTSSKKVKNRLYYLLSKDEQNAVIQLKKNIDKEKELRKNHASRALSDDAKSSLQKFRQWLENELLSKLSNDSLVSKKTIYDKCGVLGRSYEESSLYRHYLELCFGKDKDNNLIDTLVINLDAQDKDKINVLKLLLKNVENTLVENQEALSKEKRLLENVKDIKTISSEELVIDDQEETKELRQLEEKLEKLNQKIQTHKEESVNKQEEITKKIEDVYKKLNDTTFHDNMAKKFCMNLLNALQKDRKSQLSEQEIENFSDMLKLTAYKILFEFNLLLDYQKFQYNRSTKLIEEINKIKNFEQLVDFVISYKKSFSELTYSDTRKILFNHPVSNWALRSALAKSLLLIFIQLKEGKYIELERGLINKYQEICLNDMYKFKLLLPILYEVKEQNNWAQTIKHLLKNINSRMFSYELIKGEERIIIDTAQCYNKSNSFIGFENIFYSEKFIQDASNFVVKDLSDDKKKYEDIHKGYKYIIDDYFKIFFKQNIYGEDNINAFIKNFIKLINVFFCDSGEPLKYEDGNYKGLMYPKHNDFYKYEENSEYSKYCELIKQLLSDVFCKFDIKLNDLNVKDVSDFFIKEKKNEDRKIFKNKTHIINQQKKMISDFYDLEVTNLENDAKELKQKIDRLKYVLTNKFSDNILSEKHVDSIPRQSIIYQWKIRIANKIRALLQEDNLKLLLDKNDDNKNDDNKNYDNDDINDIFKIIQYIDNNDDFNFLCSIINLNIFNNDMEKIRRYLELLLCVKYNANQHKEHYLFSGDPGTGKSAFLPFALKTFIKNISKYSAELANYLNHNIKIFTISKGYYKAAGSVEMGLPGDIKTIISSQNQSNLLFVLYDECDAFIAKKESEKSNQDNAEVDTFLTMLDNSKEQRYSFIGTTNLKEFNTASVRAGRLNNISVLKPTKFALSANLKTQSNILKTLIEGCQSKKDIEFYEKRKQAIELLSFSITNNIDPEDFDNKNFNDIEALINKTMKTMKTIE